MFHGEHGEVMKKLKHNHKYRKVDIHYAKVFACALPDCTHFMPKNMAHMIIGKVSICWGCEEPFAFSDENLKEEYPKCQLCKMRDNGVDVDAILAIGKE
jgi:hypothetical protein